MDENATGRPTGAALPGNTTIVPSTPARRLSCALGWMIDMLLLWQERNAQRRALARLSDDLLKDIGVSRLEAHSESIKRPWRD